MVGSNTTVTIRNTRISSYGSIGISGTSRSNNCYLIIERSLVKARGFYGSVNSLTNLTLTQCSITQPANAVFENGFVKEDGGVVTSEVTITPIAMVNTNEATSITENSAVLNGITEQGTGTITERGFEWK